MKYSSITLSAIIATLHPRQTSATFTINAADSSTGQIGASGSSCVNFSLYSVAYQSIPGHGVCMTQAMPPSNPDWDSDATEKSPVYDIIDTSLENDIDPTVIIDTITDPELDDGRFLFFFKEVNLRQYGCVDLQGRSAGYTGSSLDRLYAITQPFAPDNVQEDVQGTLGDIAYSAQGNI
eukprot:scaffold206223_cov23-Cyclotella_meneghiniana.AAC.1